MRTDNYDIVFDNIFWSLRKFKKENGNVELKTYHNGFVIIIRNDDDTKDTITVDIE